MSDFFLQEVPQKLDEDIANQVAKQLRGRHEPASDKIFFSLESRTIRRFQLEAYVEGHRFLSDEAQRAGGTGTGPAPLRYFIAGIVLCVQVWFIKMAAYNSVPLTGLQLKADVYHEHGDFPLMEDGSYDINSPMSAGRGFGKVALTAYVKTDWEGRDHDEDIVALAKSAARSCPAAVTASRGCELTLTVVHNGTEIREVLSA